MNSINAVRKPNSAIKTGTGMAGKLVEMNITAPLSNNAMTLLTMKKNGSVDLLPEMTGVLNDVDVFMVREEAVSFG